MKGWTLHELLALPESYHRTLVRLVMDEAEAIERHRASARLMPPPPRRR